MIGLIIQLMEAIMGRRPQTETVEDAIKRHEDQIDRMRLVLLELINGPQPGESQREWATRSRSLLMTDQERGES